MAKMDLLALEPNQVRRDLSGYIVFIYGAPKTGKTTLAVQAPDALLIAAEKGYNALPGVFAQDIGSWTDLKEAYRQLKQPAVRERYKTLVFDTVDLIAKFCVEQVCRELGVQDIGDRSLMGQGYTRARNEFERVFNSLTQLGYGVIFLGHPSEKTVKLPNGQEYTQIFPALGPGKMRQTIEGMADIYGYAHYNEEQKAILTIRHDDSITCGSRLRYIDSEIDFNYQSLVDALGRAVDGVVQNEGKEATTSAPREKVAFTAMDFEILQKDFKEAVKGIQDSVEPETFSGTWAPKIAKIVANRLGEGTKVADCTVEHAPALEQIIADVKALTV